MDILILCLLSIYKIFTTTKYYRGADILLTVNNDYSFCRLQNIPREITNDTNYNYKRN